MEKYINESKESLIDRIKDLENLVEALKEDKNQEELLAFPWTGNLGHWYWNVKNDSLLCNDKKITALNYKKEDIPEDLGFEFFTSKLHPDDYEMVMENMRQHLSGKRDSFEVEYRIQTKEGNWKWYYDIGKVTKYDKNNKALFLAGIVFDITEKKDIELLIQKQNKELKEMVNLDYLTKSFNRRALYSNLQKEIEIAEKYNQKLSIIMIDVDKFKAINDKHGHLVGDLVLKRIANNMKKNVLGTDITGRYGGEEFLVILPNAGIKEACIVAERIRNSIKNEQFTNGVRVTISGGVREYKGESIDELLDGADKALYEAKNQGRNRTVCCGYND